MMAVTHGPSDIVLSLEEHAKLWTKVPLRATLVPAFTAILCIQGGTLEIHLRFPMFS